MTNRNRRALLGAIVAATLASASGQLSGYTNSSYARTLSQRLFRTQLAVLQATPLTCALPVGSDGTVGNMWARLKSGSSSIATVNSLAIGASVPIPISDLEGPVPWLLGTWFPNQANVTFKYVAVKINSNVVPMHDRTAVAVAAMTATGADCILDGITVDTKVSAIFRMSSPISAYGYQVVTPRPTLKGETTMQQIWLWTQCATQTLAPAHCHTLSCTRPAACPVEPVSACASASRRPLSLKQLPPPLSPSPGHIPGQCGLSSLPSS